MQIVVAMSTNTTDFYLHTLHSWFTISRCRVGCLEMCCTSKYLHHEGNLNSGWLNWINCTQVSKCNSKMQAAFFCDSCDLKMMRCMDKSEQRDKVAWHCILVGLQIVMSLLDCHWMKWPVVAGLLFEIFLANSLSQIWITKTFPCWTFKILYINLIWSNSVEK